MTEADIEALFASHQRRLRAVAYRWTRNREAAEDAVSVAFLRLWKARDTIAEPKYAGTWLQSTIVNYCRDQWRNRRLERENTVPLPPTLDQPSPAPGPDLAVEVEHALRGRKHGWMLYRHYVQGYSTADIAFEADCPIPTVKTRMARARRHEVGASRN
jgi:RNA polymerase sigma-70 factor (ECF subfamily)